MGNRIAELRKRRKLSQEKLAELVGTGRSTIVKLERGEMNLTQRWMLRLARPLDTAPTDLIDDQETVPLLWRVASAFSDERPETFGPAPKPRRVHAPPALDRPEDCFCAEVLDDSASELYPRGSLLFCRRIATAGPRLLRGAKVLVQNLGAGALGMPDTATEVLVGVLDLSLSGDLLLSMRSMCAEIPGSLLIQAARRPDSRFAEAVPALRLVDDPIPYEFRPGDRTEILGVVVMATTPE